MITTVIVFALLLALYLYGTRTFNYWQKRGIKHDTPILLFGTNAKNYLLQRSFSLVVADTYWKYPNEKVVGFFRSTRPELVIRDPGIIKRILVTDFAFFHMRGQLPHKNINELLLRNIFLADGDLWRLLRQCTAPMFTISKLQLMFPSIVECAQQLQAYTLAATALGHPLDARNLMERYLISLMGVIGFGLDAKSFNEELSNFLNLGVSIFKKGLTRSVLLSLKDIFPDLFQHFKVFPEIEKPICNLVSSILKHRNHKPTGRSDYIDMLLERQAKGKIVGKSLEKVKSNGVSEMVSMELSDELIASQLFIFFAAGFETSSATTSFTLHQLAYHPSIQKKVQAEIDQVLAQHENKLCYEAVKKMTFLECAVKEAMRMFAPVGHLLRKCVKAYTIPELGVTIDEGVGVIIPLQALHNDPQYFEAPQEFRPERFLPDALKESNKFVYLPFGYGPRSCIGLRLGLLQSMAGLAALLSRFSVKPASTSLRHPAVDPTFNIAQRFDGLPLIFYDRCIGNES